MEKPKYKLYAGKLTDLHENIRFSFYARGSKYILVFSDIEPTGFIEVTEEMQTKLKKEEREWLLKCKMTVSTEHIMENSKEYSKALMEYADTLEEMLKEEVKKQEEEANK